MSAPTRAELTEALQRLARAPDDQHAWYVVFTASWPTALAAAHRIVGGELDLAQDAAQEAFRRIVCYCDFSAIPDADAFLAYLHKVAQNTALTLLRQVAPYARPQLLDELGIAPEATTPGGGYGPEQWLRREDLVRELVAELDDDERQLVHLLLEDRSLSDIAGRLGVSYSAAGVRVHRLRAKLGRVRREKRL